MNKFLVGFFTLWASSAFASAADMMSTETHTAAPNRFEQQLQQIVAQSNPSDSSTEANNNKQQRLENPLEKLQTTKQTPPKTLERKAPIEDKKNTIGEQSESTQATQNAATNAEQQNNALTNSTSNDTDTTEQPAPAAQARLDELRENATAMREKENSTANTLLGAASMGVTGIGSAVTASALAEQNADRNAEQQMTAYLNTFQCRYGNNATVPGGTVEITLAGGNDLISLYTEYVNLANQLKQDKAALNMAPGIESQTILDSATSGLYDDIPGNGTNGVYTSLARALSDPNGADAAAWAAQTDASAKKLKTGAIIAAVGAVGGLVGNLAINAHAKKESSEAINAKYDKMDKMQAEIAALPITPDPETSTNQEETETTAQEEETSTESERQEQAEEQSTETPADTEETEQKTVNLSASQLFQTGSSTLTTAAKDIIEKFAKEVVNASEEGTQYCITVVGHTDKTGQASFNQKLSQQRATAVSKVLTEAGIPNEYVQSYGNASKDCTLPGRQESCRRVDITYTPDVCSTQS